MGTGAIYRQLHFEDCGLSYTMYVKRRSARVPVRAVGRMTMKEGSCRAFKLPCDIAANVQIDGSYRSGSLPSQAESDRCAKASQPDLWPRSGVAISPRAHRQPPREALLYLSAPIAQGGGPAP